MEDFEIEQIKYRMEYRRLVIERDKVCQHCGGIEKLEVHHKTYENIYNELEHLDDLILLCSKCHHQYKNIYLKSKRSVFFDIDQKIKLMNNNDNSIK